MKNYKQFIQQLPNTTLVCAIGEFNPPTTSHELLIKTVQVVAEQKGADHIVFTSKTSSLQEDKKHNFLKLMFPKNNFISLGESFFSTAIKKLNEKYKNIIIISGADQFDKFTSLQEGTIKIISIGTKNPDEDSQKMVQLASKGLYEEFKKHLPSTIRDLDAKRMMNEIRINNGLETIKDNIVLVKNKLREQYFRGEIFNIGEIVESDGCQYEIVKRGSNHLLLKSEDGSLVSKWITDVNEAVIQPDGTDKIEPNVPENDTAKPAKTSPKGKVKGFLTFYNYDDKELNIDEQFTDSEIENMLNELNEEDLICLEEHASWDLVYDDDNEVIPEHPEEEQIELMEVLSRQERIRAKIKLRKTQAKRTRSTKISLHRYSDPKTINKRARRLAIKLIKQRMMRGRKYSQASVGEKEKMETSINKNKGLVDRVAQKLVSRIRKVEKSRMSKGKSPKGNMPSVF